MPRNVQRWFNMGQPPIKRVGGVIGYYLSNLSFLTLGVALSQFYGSNIVKINESQWLDFFRQVQKTNYLLLTARDAGVPKEMGNNSK
mmetsp:Transcript_2140/g.3769  ORF Transcript_2140/g.3769 Transcript_2140/m.3769 type:complete len:87 (+) Transcript_2140:33-293(+)